MVGALEEGGGRQEMCCEVTQFLTCLMFCKSKTMKVEDLWKFSMKVEDLRKFSIIVRNAYPFSFLPAVPLI